MMINKGNMELEKLLSQTSIIKEIENLKNQVDALKPFPNDIEQKILQKFRLDWNYHSNAIEGNPYTYGETLTFIMHGITAKGKTMKDHFDVKGHNDGINFILSLVKDERSISESDIRALHRLILVEPYEVDTITPSGLPSKKMILIGDYKKEPNHVKTKTGEIHYYASPEDTPFLMAELIKWYNQCAENKEIHPLVTAALFHHKLTEIHPFDDGNGRMARLLMNLILLKSGFPPVVVRNEDKNNYYETLSLADAGEKRHIVEYLGNLLVHSLNIYIKAAKGETIEDESDIDKEIALFKAGLEKENYVEKNLDLDTAYLIFDSLKTGLFKEILTKAEIFADIFIKINHIYEAGFMDENRDIKLKSIDSDSLHSIIFSRKSTKYTLFIEFTLTLNGFKKNKLCFDISDKILIAMDEYFYEIYYDKNLSIHKKYHESLNKYEIKSISTSFIRSILKSIEANNKT